MRTPAGYGQLLTTAVGAVAVLSGTSLQAANTYADLTASAGYSTNPYLRIIDPEGSAFGRISARGVQEWQGPLSSTAITGFAEVSKYTGENGVQSLFSLDANHTRRVSERTSIFGSVGASADKGAQLSNRFLYVPGNVQIPDETELPPPTTIDPYVYSFAGRQYRAYVQGGASTRVSERGTVTASAGVSRNTFSGGNLVDFTTVFGTASYQHTLSERTSVGFDLSGSRTSYEGPRESTAVINPALSVRTRINEQLEASGAVGVSLANRGGGDFSTDLSLRGSLCRTTSADRLCARVDRYSQPSADGFLTTTTSAGVDLFRKIDAEQTLQLSASATLYRDDEDADADSGFRRNSDFYRINGSYSRLISERLSAGVDVNGRTLRRDGPDPRADLGASIFLRYRLGDIR